MQLNLHLFFYVSTQMTSPFNKKRMDVSTLPVSQWANLRRKQYTTLFIVKANKKTA